MSRTRSLCCAAIGIVLAGLIAGCGGGGGGDGTSLSAAFGTITGTVADVGQVTRAPSGTVTVSVDGTDISTQAGTDGSFVLDHVPTGMHTLVAGTQSRACAFVVDVQAGRATDVGQIALADAGQISGMVSSAADHTPISGATVAVTEMVQDSTNEMPHPVRVRHTDGAGSYMVQALPAGEYLVTISKAGYQTSSLDRTVTANTTTTGDASLQPNSPASSGSLAGTVFAQTDSGDTKPIGGVLVRVTPSVQPVDTRPLPDQAFDSNGTKVELYPGVIAPPPPPGGSVPFDEYYTFSDDAGAYRIDGIPAGTYTAVAVRPGLQADQQSVAITVGSVTTQNFTLLLIQPKFGTVRVTVTDSSTTQPIQGAIVRAVIAPPMPPAVMGARGSEGGGAIILPDPSLCVMLARTDEKGQATLKVPVQVTEIGVWAVGYVAQESPVAVVAGGSVTVAVALVPDSGVQTFTLSGIVTTQASPSGPVVLVEGATVTATQLDSPLMNSRPGLIQFTATTDANGAYTLKLNGGQYNLSAFKGDLRSGDVKLQIKADAVQDLLLTEELLIPPPPPPP